jgi:hypothetical protein
MTIFSYAILIVLASLIIHLVKELIYSYSTIFLSKLIVVLTTLTLPLTLANTSLIDDQNLD